MYTSGEAVRLRLSGEAALNEVFIVEQGKPFSLCFECVGDSGELMILGIMHVLASTDAVYIYNVDVCVRI